MTKPLAWDLKPGEKLLWQGRPAPRCYVFRHWLQALVGTVLFLASSFWLMVGYQLVEAHGYNRWLLVIPGLLVLFSFLVGPGQVIMARVRWEKVFYALTDERLLVRRSLSASRTEAYAMDKFKGCRKKRYGKQQVSFRLSFDGHRPVVLECLEYPDNFSRHLPQA